MIFSLEVLKNLAISLIKNTLEGLLIKSMSANDLNDKLQELIVTQHTELTDGRRYFFFSKPIVEYTPDIFQTNNKSKN